MPLSTIFSNALEIIFSFLSLPELSRMLRTSHRFYHFLSSASRYNQLKVHLRLDNARRYGKIFQSRGLRRRITTLTLDGVSPHARIAALFPHLEQLNYLRLDTTELPAYKSATIMPLNDAVLQESLVWPRRLQTLRISAKGHSRSNQILVKLICCFPTLTQLDITFGFTNVRVHAQQLNLKPLQRLPALRSLTSINDREDEFFDHDSAERTTFCSDLAKALAVPLPALQVLHLSWERRTADFLAELPQLTELVFIDRWIRPEGLTAEDMLPLLQGLNALTSLKLENSKLTSNHLTQLLPRLPLLTHLSLVDCEQLGSDGFLATPSLAHTLTHLTLVRPSFANVDFTPLKALTHLILVLDEPPTPEKLAMWRRFRPRWQEPDIGGTAQPRLVEFQLLVDKVDAFANLA